LAAGLRRDPLGELTASPPDLLAGFKGRALRQGGNDMGQGRGGEGREKKRME